MAAAKEYGVDDDIIASLIYVESRGNHDSVSSAGAIGLMQVMSRDGIASSYGVFGNRPTVEELMDPSFNINKGTEILAGYISQTGSVRSGLCSYYGTVGSDCEYAQLVLNILGE